MTEVKEISSSLVKRNNRRIDQAEKELEELMKLEASQQEEAPVEPEVSEPTVPETEENLSPDEETWKKRFGDLRRHQQKTEKALKDEIESLKNSVPQNPPLPKTEEEVADWVSRFPDVAAIVETLADKKAKERDSDLEARLSQIEEMRDQIDLEKAETAILKIHPDFKEISQSDEFHTWADTQPKWIQDSLYDNADAKTVARSIDLYKLDKGIKKISPDKNAALSVNTRARVTPQENEKDSWYSESQISKMSDKEFSQKSEEIEKAQREGKFHYDISRKAR
jgi:hypothetical protein